MRSSGETTQDNQQDPFQETEVDTVNIVDVERDENIEGLIGDGYASFGDEDNELEFVDENEDVIISSEDSEDSLHTSDCESSEND